MPDKKLEEIIRRILRVVVPDKIILFGSRARGEARETATTTSCSSSRVLDPKTRDPLLRISTST